MLVLEQCFYAGVIHRKRCFPHPPPKPPDNDFHGLVLRKACWSPSIPGKRSTSGVHSSPVTSCLGKAFSTCIFSYKDTLRERMRKRAEGKGEEEGGAGEEGREGRGEAVSAHSSAKARALCPQPYFLRRGLSLTLEFATCLSLPVPAQLCHCRCLLPGSGGCCELSSGPHAKRMSLWRGLERCLQEGEAVGARNTGRRHALKLGACSRR